METGQQCPKCGTERTPTGTLACSCTRRPANPPFGIPGPESRGTRPHTTEDRGTGAHREPHGADVHADVTGAGARGGHAPATSRAAVSAVATRTPGASSASGRASGVSVTSASVDGSAAPTDATRSGISDVLDTSDASNDTSGTAGATGAPNERGGSGGSGRRDWFEARSDHRQGSGASGGADADAPDDDRPDAGGPSRPSRPGGPGSFEASGEPDGSAGDTDEFEPLHLRPYVSLHEAEAHAEPSPGPDPSAYESGGLLGPDGPLSWSIDDIWGPDESAGKNAHDDSQNPSGAGADSTSTPAGQGGADDAGTATSSEAARPTGPEAGSRPTAPEAAVPSPGGAHTRPFDRFAFGADTDGGGEGLSAPARTGGTGGTDETEAISGLVGPRDVTFTHDAEGYDDTADATDADTADADADARSNRAAADADPPEDDPETYEESTAPRRRRLALLVGAGVAVVAVVTLAVGGVFSQDEPSHDDALPGTDVGTSAPAQGEAAPSESAPGDRAPATPGAPAASANRTASPSPSGTPSHSAPPAAEAPTAGATGTVQPAPPDGPAGPPVLRVGDQGAEVKELQLRLRQLLLYLGSADGVYDSGIEDVISGYQRNRDIKGDEKGVYGPATRHQLESETREP